MYTILTLLGLIVGSAAVYYSKKQYELQKNQKTSSPPAVEDIVLKEDIRLVEDSTSINNNVDPAGELGDDYYADLWKGMLRTKRHGDDLRIDEID